MCNLTPDVTSQRPPQVCWKAGPPGMLSRVVSGRQHAGIILHEATAGSPRSLIPDHITRRACQNEIAFIHSCAQKNGRLEPPVRVTATSYIGYFFLAGDLTEIATASV